MKTRQLGLVVALALAAGALAARQPVPVSHAETPSDAVAVRCVLDYATGSEAIASCKAWTVGTFTVVPAGKYFSITDITITPGGPVSNTSGASGPAVTMLSLQSVSTGLWDRMTIQVDGSGSWSQSYRATPLRMVEGTSLRVGSAWWSAGPGQILVTGILSSDPQASIR
jgi:hypothetical protein